MTRCVKITSAYSCLETKSESESELHHSLLLLQFGGQLCCDRANGIEIWPVAYNNLFNCILLCAKVSFISTQLE